MPLGATPSTQSLVQEAGGGSVPLSRAICCRPCIPDGLPDDNPAVGIVSVGCHKSTNRPVDRLMCETMGNSMGVGMWGRHYSQLGKYYCLVG